MAGTDPAADRNNAQPVSAGRSNLALRVLSSLVLIPLALFVAWLGGWAFNLFWGIAALLIVYEWTKLTVGSASPRALDMRTSLWVCAGLIYAAALMMAACVLRADDSTGLVAILFLFAVVWGTDIAAYFAGRTFGGPKLMPRVSPKKTWSGALGGTFAGVAAAVVVAWLAGLRNLGAIALVALVLSFVSQAGDLMESALKRQFGAKDSGGLLPGHGGLMDRLDGFAVAVVVAAVIGIVRGGLDAPARGLLVW